MHPHHHNRRPCEDYPELEDKTPIPLGTHDNSDTSQLSHPKNEKITSANKTRKTDQNEIRERRKDDCNKSY